VPLPSLWPLLSGMIASFPFYNLMGVYFLSAHLFHQIPPRQFAKCIV
jgi:hypothetical protein